MHLVHRSAERSIEKRKRTEALRREEERERKTPGEIPLPALLPRIDARGQHRTVIPLPSPRDREGCAVQEKHGVK